MANAEHTQPRETDRVYLEWTIEAETVRDLQRDATTRLGMAMLAEAIARKRSDWCGNFPLRVLLEDILCAKAGYQFDPEMVCLGEK